MKKKAKKRTRKTDRSRSRKHPAVFAVACPKCGVGKGRVCVTRWLSRTETHAARIKLYRNLPSDEAAQQSVSPETPPAAESSDPDIGRGPGTEA